MINLNKIAKRVSEDQWSRDLGQHWGYGTDQVEHPACSREQAELPECPTGIHEQGWEYYHEAIGVENSWRHAVMTALTHLLAGEWAYANMWLDTASECELQYGDDPSTQRVRAEIDSMLTRPLDVASREVVLTDGMIMVFLKSLDSDDSEEQEVIIMARSALAGSIKDREIIADTLDSERDDGLAIVPNPTAWRTNLGLPGKATSENKQASPRSRDDR